MNYTFFVDESGQSGIKKIRTGSSSGASRYMTLGGVLIPNSKLVEFRAILSALAGEFSKPELHCSKLNHNQIVRFAQEVSNLQLLLFGVISLKETLGGYRADIDGSDKLYYNKCAQYLLERLGQAMGKLDIRASQVSVVFEDGNFEYQKLRNLIGKCREKPMHKNTRFLRNIEPFSIRAIPKSGESLLQIADLVAHGLYRCVDDGPSTFGMRETRYINELRSRFHMGASGEICGFGIYAVHNVAQVKATKEVQTFLSGLNVS